MCLFNASLYLNTQKKINPTEINTCKINTNSPQKYLTMGVKKQIKPVCHKS